MRISVFFSHINKAVEQGSWKNNAEALTDLASQGLECVDVNGAAIGTMYDLKELKKELDDSGIKTSSIFHFAPFDWKDENILEKYREITKRQIEYCAYLETDVFMPVPNIRELHKTPQERVDCQKKIIEYLNETAALSKACNVSTVLENYSSKNNPYSTLEDFEIIFKNTTDVDYVLDTGNFWFCDVDFIEAYEKYHSITKHVHLKEINPADDGYLKVNGKNADSHDIGSGVSDFPELFKRLKGYGYDGAVSIEICNADDMKNKIIRSVKYVEKLRG